jgi:hypothetical protein
MGNDRRLALYHRYLRAFLAADPCYVLSAIPFRDDVDSRRAATPRWTNSKLGDYIVLAIARGIAEGREQGVKLGVQMTTASNDA